MNTFQNIINESVLILTEGAIAERLKREHGLETDPFINHAGLLYKVPSIFEEFYRQYIDIARKYDLPIMIMSPTRSVNYNSLNASKFYDKNIITDACQFIKKIKNSYDDFSDKIFTGGLLGCKGDAYSGTKLMNIDEAYSFHKKQTVQYQGQDIDFLFAGIMPEINEAIGLAMAMAETGLPYIISFMIRKNGCLMDGTFLSDAIRLIDKQVSPKPFFYMTNCIHPTNLIKALQIKENLNSPFIKRFKGIQANSSALSPEELNGCSILHQEEADDLIHQMIVLQKDYNLKVFGGCCGTDDRFLEQLSDKLKSTLSNE